MNILSSTIKHLPKKNKKTNTKNTCISHSHTHSYLLIAAPLKHIFTWIHGAFFGVLCEALFSAFCCFFWCFFFLSLHFAIAFHGTYFNRTISNILEINLVLQSSWGKNHAHAYTHTYIHIYTSITPVIFQMQMLQKYLLLFFHLLLYVINTFWPQYGLFARLS